MLKDKVAVITGSTSGIGLGIAREQLFPLLLILEFRYEQVGALQLHLDR